MTSLLNSVSAIRLRSLWLKKPVLLNASITGSECLHTGEVMHQAKGEIASKTPSKISCEAGKTYVWCACGLSGKQPFCDGSHKQSSLGLTPVKWVAKDSKDYFFCNCKQSNKHPLCDGSHKKL